MNYLYISDDKLFMFNGKKSVELSSERVTKYRESVKSIQEKKKWKNSGTGAKFTGAYVDENFESENIKPSYGNISILNDGFLYSVSIGEISGLYIKSTDTEETSEQHIYTSNNFRFFEMDVKDSKCAVSIGSMEQSNLAVFEIPSGSYTELTDGDTCEIHPSFSQGRNKIYFSSSGNARNEYGAIAAKSPYSAAVYDLNKNTIDYIFESDEYDYVHVKDDMDGNVYFIKRPYTQNHSNGFSILDILFFPFRIIKAIFGFLNVFSIIFGGESLNSKKNPSSNVKSKQMSEKDIIIDGNRINAENIYKGNQKKSEKYPGIIPHSWELIKVSDNGEQICIKKGVMDYTLCENGDIIYSNGRSFIRMQPNGNEVHICDCYLGKSIVEID